jgi:hypothetical protein
MTDVIEVNRPKNEFKSFVQTFRSPLPCEALIRKGLSQCQDCEKEYEKHPCISREKEPLIQNCKVAGGIYILEVEGDDIPWMITVHSDLIDDVYAHVYKYDRLTPEFKEAYIKRGSRKAWVD